MICAVIPQPEEIALDADKDEQTRPMEEIRNASGCETVKSILFHNLSMRGSRSRLL
jgi:hypothetical protein